MNDAELAARGQRAERALEEFFRPACDTIRAHMLERQSAVARNELDSRVMADKVRNLSIAYKVADEIEGVLQSIIAEGEVSARTLARLRRMEEMTPAKQRMLNIAPRTY